MMTARVVCLVVLAAGCSTPPVQPPPQDPSLVVGGSTPVMPLDHPPVGPSGPASGGSRRLNVAQLRASLPVILDGETWRVGGTNGFDARAATLGEPDYLSVVDENLEASPLYLKLMGDMARDACNRALVADQAQPVMANRVLMKFADVDANLRYLRLAFHGMKVADTDEAPIAPMRTLFTEAAKADPIEGWRAVCVAMLTAPEYHLH